MSLQAQSEQPRRTTSFGIDLIIAVIGLSEQNDVSPSSLEIIYREHLEKSAIRFRATVTNFQNESRQISGFKVDSTFIRSYYFPNKRLGIALGGEYQLTKTKNYLYGGADLGFNYEKGAVRADVCLEEECEELKKLQAKSYSIEINPFIGWHFNLNPRFFLNIELGPYVLFNFGERPYADENLAIQQFAISDTEIHMGRLLRDISINYRF